MDIEGQAYGWYKLMSSQILWSNYVIITCCTTKFIVYSLGKLTKFSIFICLIAVCSGVFTCKMNENLKFIIEVILYSQKDEIRLMANIRILAWLFDVRMDCYLQIIHLMMMFYIVTVEGNKNIQTKK